MIDRMQVYSKSELNQVHDASMEILGSLGTLFHHPEAVALFQQHGFRVDGSRVFISERDVIHALGTVPSRFRLHSRNPVRSVWIGGDDYVLVPTGGAPNVATVDGAQRPATLEDYHTCCKLVQTSNQLDMIDNLIVQPSDVDPAVCHLDMLHAMILMCDKPYVVGTDTRTSVDDILSMAAILCGGREALSARAVLAAVASPISPLQYGDAQGYAILQMARHRQPLILTNMLMAGMSGPILLPGLMALLNAEILGGLVLSQLAGPGTPVVYGSTSAPMDMKTSISAVGAPETCVIASATIQMAQYYHLPCRTGGMLTDAHVPDAQALAEGTLLMSTVIRDGANVIIHACGQISSFMAMSFEKWLIDEEVCRMIRAVLSQVPITPETLDLETIKTVGVGGHYLFHPSTFERFRSLTQPEIFNRRSQAEWRLRGSRRAEEEATAILPERLAGYERPLLDEGVERELAAFVKTRKEEVTGNDGAGPV